MRILHSNWIRTVIAVTISLLLLFLLFYKIDACKVFSIICTSNLKLILLAAAISLSVNIFLGVIKWRRILAALGCSLPFKEALAVYSGCLPLRVVFPMKSNELFKAFYLQRQKGFPFLRGFSSIILDKTLNLLVILCIFLIGLSLVEVKFPKVLPIVASLVLIALLFSTPLRSMVIRLARAIHPRLHRFTEQLLSGFADISTKEKIILTGYSVIFQFSEFINTYILLRAVGVWVPFAMVLVFIPLIVIINNLPITMLGLGTREALIIFLFAKYGQSTSLLSASLLVSFIEYILPVLFGIFFIKSFLPVLPTH